jgi:Tfp pilus assembly protein PilF
MNTRLLRTLLGLLAGYAALTTPAATQEPAAARPAWQRVLQGPEAKKAAELQERLDQLEDAGKWEEALRVAEELLQLRQKGQGKDHWEAVDVRWRVQALQAVQRQSKELQQEFAGVSALYRESQALEARGRYREAQPQREKMLDIRRKVLGDRHPHTALSYGAVAFSLQVQGKYAAAEEGVRKALGIFLEVLGTEHPHTAQCYYNLAANLEAQGKYAAAEDGFRKAADIFRQVLGEEHAHTASCLAALAGNQYAQGKYAAAEEGFRRVLEVRRKVLGEKHPDTAQSYDNLAANLHAQGKYAEAEEGFRKALEIRREVLGAEHPLTARSYAGIASTLHAQGKSAAAEESVREALAICRKVLGEEHPDTAQSYNNVAANLHAQGKYVAAEEGFRKALAIRRKVRGEEHPDTADSYAGVALALEGQGKYVAAEEGLRKALNIYRKVLGDEHPRTARSCNDLAFNLQGQGQYAAAEEGFRKALDTFRKVLGDQHPETANSYHNVAFILHKQGKDVAAEEASRKALQIHRQVLGEEHPETALGYNNLAVILHAQGKYAEAEKLWLRAADAFASARLRLAHSGLERATFASQRSPLPRLAAVLARNGKPAAAWRYLEESLARGSWDDLSARLRRPAAEQARQAALTARLGRLDLLIEKAVAVKDETPQQKEQREALLGQRRKAQEDLDAFMHHLEATYGPAAGQVFDIPRVQAALADDMALVAWIDLKPTGPKAADPNGERWAFLLRSRGDPVCVHLTGSGAGGAWTEEDSTLPARLRAALQVSQGGWREPARRLYEQRLQPLAKYLRAGDGLPAVRHLVVLPSSALRGVPWEVVAGDCTVSYVSSGTLYAHLRQQPAVKSAGLLAVGDPVFEPAKAAKERPLPPGGLLLTLVQPGSNAAQSGLRPDDVLLKYGDSELKTPADLKPALAAADPKSEVAVRVWREGATFRRQVHPGPLGVIVAGKPAPEALAERYRSDRLLATRSSDEGWKALPWTRVEVESLRRLFPDTPRPKLLFDSDASEQSLDALAQTGELSRYRYLHLATHGEVDDTVPLRSAVILSRDSLPDPQQQLLAGKPVYDGRLTAEEMLRSWHLDTELVTLSACQTALGKYEYGEGFMGFAQSLLVCGSRSVCLSLWKVDDAATALLMQRFYANLLGKRDGLKGPLPKARALREAKEWLRGVTREEALRVAATVSEGVERGKDRPRQKLLPSVPGPAAAAKEDRPYAHPYYWAAFILIGDPG